MVVPNRCDCSCCNKKPDHLAFSSWANNGNATQLTFSLCTQPTFLCVINKWSRFTQCYGTLRMGPVCLYRNKIISLYTFSKNRSYVFYEFCGDTSRKHNIYIYFMLLTFHEIQLFHTVCERSISFGTFPEQMHTQFAN